MVRQKRGSTGTQEEEEEGETEREKEGSKDWEKWGGIDCIEIERKRSKREILEEEVGNWI